MISDSAILVASLEGDSSAHGVGTLLGHYIVDGPHGLTTGVTEALIQALLILPFKVTHDRLSGTLAMRFSEAYNVRSSFLVGCGPVASCQHAG